MAYMIWWPVKKRLERLRTQALLSPLRPEGLLESLKSLGSDTPKNGSGSNEGTSNNREDTLDSRYKQGK